jgi:hypothetical protein
MLAHAVNFNKSSEYPATTTKADNEIRTIAVLGTITISRIITVPSSEKDTRPAH